MSVYLLLQTLLHGSSLSILNIRLPTGQSLFLHNHLVLQLKKVSVEQLRPDSHMFIPLLFISVSEHVSSLVRVENIDLQLFAFLLFEFIFYFILQGVLRVFMELGDGV